MVVHFERYSFNAEGLVQDYSVARNLIVNAITEHVVDLKAQISLSNQVSVRRFGELQNSYLKDSFTSLNCIGGDD